LPGPRGVTLLALIRHRPTAWNAAGRMQGRADPPLDRDEGGERAEWRLPLEFCGSRMLSSPLRRAVDTARLFGEEPVLEPRLVEMDWGAWEGFTLAELRARLGPAMAAEEARGLDFRPPGGESPRDVQARLAPLFSELAKSGRPAAAVTHKGVIRTVLASATGWDMRGKPPARLVWDAAHLFRLDADGRPRVEQLNLPLWAETPAR
jgi:probable phosphoglycerate mutase